MSRKGNPGALVTFAIVRVSTYPVCEVAHDDGGVPFQGKNVRKRIVKLGLLVRPSEALDADALRLGSSGRFYVFSALCQPKHKLINEKFVHRSLETAFATSQIYAVVVWSFDRHPTFGIRYTIDVALSVG